MGVLRDAGPEWNRSHESRLRLPAASCANLDRVERAGRQWPGARLPDQRI
jgi:hypothetical protein